MPGATALLRNEPVQARSTARLTSLLDAAAEVVDEIGFERLTTAMVAERAGASIGTVYRYFPDRIAVLHSALSDGERYDAWLALRRGDKRIAVNKQDVTLPELEKRLRDIFEQRKDKTMFLIASGTLRYREIVAVIDAARSARGVAA